MGTIDTNGLENFISKIKDKRVKLKNIQEKIKTIGIEEFEKAYSSDSEFSGLVISGEIHSDGSVEIKATDTKDDVDIAFIEFGTGFYSMQYEGELPKQTITFTTESGRTGATAGWIYYYDSPAKRENKSGSGWYLPKVKGGYFDTGMNAHNTFYRACQEIKKRIKKELY